MAVHHAELLQERNSRLEIQRLYEAIQIEIKQKTTSFQTQLSQKDIAIQAAESATLKVRQQCQIDVEKLNVKIRGFDKITADLNSKHSIIISDLKSSHSTLVMGLEARIAELESEIQDLEATFELDNNLKDRQETLVHHLQLQVSDLNLALESKDSEAQKATYDLRISMQGQISGLQSSLDQISIELSQKNRELEDLHDQYSLELQSNEQTIVN